MVSLVEQRVVMVFCAHTTLCPEIFQCLLIFAQRSSNVLWYFCKTDFCVSADICPKIFAHLLIFAHVTLQNYWYLTTDLLTSAGICPQSLHICQVFESTRNMMDILPEPVQTRGEVPSSPTVGSITIYFVKKKDGGILKLKKVEF